MTTLGRLERIPALRETWPDEARDFTPWLAREDNLSLLSEFLGLGSDGLELEAVERLVGPYRADILCRRTDDGSWVLIENQLERTDHSHLGQIVTYAAGLDAGVVVWISAGVTPEHRAAVDWLNRIAGEDGPSFFALEIELWRIGGSPAAPRFNAVASPNDWSRQASKAKASLAEGGLTGHQQTQLEYWTLVEAEIGASAPFRARSAQGRSSMQHSMGRTGVLLSLAINFRRRRVSSSIYLSGGHEGLVYMFLDGQRETIESSFGGSLVWRRLPESTYSLISSHLEDADPADRDDWPRQHRWLLDTASRMHEAFRPVIAAMPRDLPDEESP
jgi:hypothetical protein